MSRGKELAKNTVILSVGRLGTQIVQFLLLPLYTALLTQEEYGTVDLFNTYITLLLPLFNWQFDRGLFRFLVDCRDDENQQINLISTVFVCHLIQASFYLVFYAIASRYIHSPYKIFLALDVLVSIFLNSMLQIARGKGQNGIYALASFLSISLAAVFNVVFLVGFHMGAWGLFGATLLAKVITLIYTVVSYRIWHFLKVRAVNRNTFWKMLHYSIPLIPNSLSWWVISASDRTVITRFLSVSANGIYAVANKFPNFFIGIYTVFDMAWTETVSLHITDEDRDSFLTESVNHIFMFFSCMCIGLIACMPFIFPLFVNQQFAEAYEQIPILIVAMLFRVVVGLYSAIYIALKKTGAVAKTSAGVAIVNLVINLLLISAIGLYAASLSTLVAFAIMAVYRYFDVKKYVRVPLKRSYVIKIIIVGSVVMGAYYVELGHIWLKLVALFLAVIFSLRENYNFLKSIPTFLKRKKMISKEKKRVSGY